MVGMQVQRNRTPPFSHSGDNYGLCIRDTSIDCGDIVKRYSRIVEGGQMVVYVTKKKLNVSWS